jgi:hypothetical protein
MALISPGVEVSIIDESTYIPSATNSVPYILVATAQNKATPSGIGVAAGTLASNANQIYLITSQRDLVNTFGNPFFYKTTAGTPINGYELNEYGLLAAYSALGVSNRAYIQRVNVDLSELTASLTRPVGEPDNNTYWLVLGATAWGIFEWNQTTGSFINRIPLEITNVNNLTAGVPNSDFGSIGDYAVVTTNTANPLYYKNGTVSSSQSTAIELTDLYNSWVLVGSDAWKLSWPTYQATNTYSGTLIDGAELIINETSVLVPSMPNNNVAGFADAINAANIQGVYAADIDGKLSLFADSSAESDGSTLDGAIRLEQGNTAGSADLIVDLGISVGIYLSPALQQSPNFTVPRWRISDTGPRPSGSIWNKITPVNLGTNMVVNKWSSLLGAWVQQDALVYQDDQSANKALDPSGGGINIPQGTTYTQYNVSPEQNITTGEFNPTFTLKLFERIADGATVITGNVGSPTFVNGDEFTIQTSTANSNTLTSPVTVTINGTTPAAFIAAVSAANVPGVSASVDSSGNVVLTQNLGGVMYVENTTGTPLTSAGFTTGIVGIRNNPEGGLILSNWAELEYSASANAPSIDPANGRYWYYSASNQIDIMINNGNGWFGYRNVNNDVRGYNLTNTDPAGPIISASEPTTQSDGTDIVYGDLWVDTSNLEVYPIIKRYENIDGVDQWVTLNNSDQTTENGILFADARWDTNGTSNVVTDNLATITSLLTSNYTDIDVPDYELYPTGMLLFNTRRSGFNVKQFRVNYFNPTDFSFDTWSSSVPYSVGDKVLYNTTLYVAIGNPPLSTVPTNASFWAPLETDAWVNASGNRNDGSPYMGRYAQREIIVSAMKSGIDASTAIREEQRQFNLIACPGYPELITNMVALNNERNNTAFVIGDTPLRLPATGTEILAWTNNTTVSGDGLAIEGTTVGDPYVGLFYPSCQTTDLSGSPVVQPPSHMMIRTIIRNDEVAFPWLAPAGSRRGVIDNAENIGYINAQTGEFVSLGVNQGLRDVLYENRVNPITFIPGVGITNFGNKTTYAITSALDRINVARLIAFIRARLESIGKQFLFEPNDQITRDEIKNAINSLMIDLVNKRGIYDFLVVCDLTNNTPARIDANELWVDIAIEPVKAVEFVYIPLRIKNTGEIAGAISTQVSAG